MRLTFLLKGGIVKLTEVVFRVRFEVAVGLEVVSRSGVGGQKAGFGICKVNTRVGALLATTGRHLTTTPTNSTLNN